MPQQPWVVLVDARRAKLFRVSMGEEGHVRLEKIDDLESQWEFPEPGRPPHWIPKAGHTDAGTAHDVEENVRRFGLQFRQWIQQHVDRLEIRQAHVFTPTRLLGMFRKLVNNGLTERLVFHDGDLATIPNPQLRRHPAITDLLQPAGARR